MLSSIHVESLFFLKTVAIGNIHGCIEKVSSCDILISDKLYNYFLIHDIN